MHMPVKTLILSSVHSSGHFLAKSGIRIKSGDNNVCIYGFGFNKGEETAKRASQFEALEHLWATLPMHSERKSFSGYLLTASNQYKEFFPYQVLDKARIFL